MCINKTAYVCTFIHQKHRLSLGCTVLVVGRCRHRRLLLVLHLLVLHRLLQQNRGDEAHEEHHVHPPVVPLPALVRLSYV